MADLGRLSHCAMSDSLRELRQKRKPKGHMNISSAVAGASLISCLVFESTAYAAEVTAISPAEYRDLEADRSLWKIDGRFPPDEPSGIMAIDTKNGLASAGFDWHASPGSNLITLAYDASQNLMTFSARGSGGDQSVGGLTVPGDTIAWRLLAFGLTNDSGSIIMSGLTVNGVSYSGEWSANRDQRFNTFMASAPGGVESVSFFINWGGPEEYQKFSIQAIGFQSVPEPGLLTFLVLGSAVLLVGGRLRKKT